MQNSIHITKAHKIYTSINNILLPNINLLCIYHSWEGTPKEVKQTLKIEFFENTCQNSDPQSIPKNQERPHTTRVNFLQSFISMTKSYISIWWWLRDSNFKRLRHPGVPGQNILCITFTNISKHTASFQLRNLSSLPILFRSFILPIARVRR